MEYYHEYKDLKTFKEKCHDYYMLFPLWCLENDYFDEVIIWRLSKQPVDDIIFDVNGKKYIQRWLPTFMKTVNYPPPEISFWRGGFPEYDQTVNLSPDFFGKKIYLGAGRRVFPQFKGKYDAHLIEDERDYVKGHHCIPFYKTASPEIFHPIKDSKIKYDICWPCNFTQLKYKGQAFFIGQVAKHPFLQKLKIIHCGNKPEVGKELCKKHGVTNIEFAGHVTRPEMNKLLNQSRFGMNLSNMTDGCPRVSTEVLMSGTPLILMDTVRILAEFRHKGVVNVSNDHDHFIMKVEWGFSHYKQLKEEVLNVIENELSFESVNQKNIDWWKKI
jgi:hypothetical protein